MNTLKRLRWGAGKVGLFAILVGIAAFALARDHRPASASHTEIFASLSSTSATYTPSVILLKGGQYAGNTPCSPGDTDPTTACLHIWAKNVDDSTGASAFQVKVAFQGIILSTASPKITWLGSTNRSVACLVPVYSPGEVVVSCNTLQAPPPYGPSCSNGHCSGELATIALESQSTVGIYTINLSQGTYLVSTPPDPNNPPAIPATVRSTNIIVAPCADFNGDGTIRVNDILYVVGKYSTDDALADLNANGTVRVDDILIAVGEYAIDCTA